VFDLGAWLWQWTSEGLVFGGENGGEPGLGVPPDAGTVPAGFRLAQDP
jgi:hypothetical protein